MPGVLSSVLLYVPLSLFAYATFISAGRVSAFEVVASGLLGLGYQAAPVIWLVVSSMTERSQAH